MGSKLSGIDELIPFTYADPRIGSRFTIRKFEEADRKYIEDICCDTAVSGIGIDRFFSDRDFYGRLLTKSYLDLEAENAYVAASQDNRVIGYMIAASGKKFDAERNKLWVKMFSGNIGKYFWEGGKYSNSMNRRFIIKLLASVPAFAPYKLDIFVHNLAKNRKWKFPGRMGHMHFNIRQEARGGLLGPVLANIFEHKMWEAGIRELYGMISWDPLPAVRMGYEAVVKRKYFAYSTKENPRYFTLIYKQLNETPRLHNILNASLSSSQQPALQQP
ncbi:TPA: hypothetical protein HA239_03185 [Candidatus Woesearchaeota archaeon]|nr:hypothetical protein QT06_C0001G0079 [archaeon GW2011_AR15]MBS3104114.1 hypothetical protein [Candidatus Woesearchaeota archaeon]HIH41394.1 hypothetical protein [Candidatus Woesearchaeota archaeon]